MTSKDRYVTRPAEADAAAIGTSGKSNQTSALCNLSRTLYWVFGRKISQVSQTRVTLESTHDVAHSLAVLWHDTCVMWFASRHRLYAILRSALLIHSSYKPLTHGRSLTLPPSLHTVVLSIVFRICGQANARAQGVSSRSREYVFGYVFTTESGETWESFIAFRKFSHCWTV